MEGPMNWGSLESQQSTQVSLCQSKVRERQRNIPSQSACLVCTVPPDGVCNIVWLHLNTCSGRQRTCASPVDRYRSCAWLLFIFSLLNWDDTQWSRLKRPQVHSFSVFLYLDGSNWQDFSGNGVNELWPICSQSCFSLSISLIIEVMLHLF